MEDNLEYPLNINYILRKKKLLKRELLNKDNFIQKNIAILGGSSTSEIVNILEIFLLKNGIKPNFYQSEYNKFYEDALFRTDELAKFNPDIVYIHTTNKNISVYPDIQDSKNDIKILFENELAKWLGAPYVVCTTSGTSALTMACLASGIGPGSEVIIPNHTAPGTAHSAMVLGAKVVPIDTKPISYACAADW